MSNVIKVKILIVDDREDNLFSMESILEKGQYHIVKASSGNAALKILLKEWDFTLILMDVEMPGMNGLETAAIIYQREKLKHIPIIFITANSYGDEKLFKGYETGAADYIFKPIQPDLLSAKVAVFAELYRKNHQLLEQEQKLKAINKNLEIEVRDRIASEEKVQELNKQLLKNIEKLESANKEMDQFANIASHDLQEPLRKIRMFNDFIVLKYRNKLDNEGQMYLDRIKVACERMQILINDIHTFSKIDVTKNALEYSDMNLLFKEVLSEMDTLIKKKNAKVYVDPLPSLYVFPALMKLLFRNLLSNSLKFSNDNLKPMIRITAIMEAPDDSFSKIKVSKYWRINVQDNGIGFEQQYANKIFTFFKRLQGNSENEGTGVGLSICKKIADVHQGHISAKSVVNKGTVFTISLPVETPAAAIKIS